jgi:hypothetical protein
MILKLLLKILGRMLIMLVILVGGGLYLGRLIGGDSNKMLELFQTALHKNVGITNLSTISADNGLPGLEQLGDVGDLLKQGAQGAAGAMPKMPTVDLAPVKPILKADEAKNDQLSPKDNPSEWDYIASKTQKCWFHKRTRKKVCEPISADP